MRSCWRDVTSTGCSSYCLILGLTFSILVASSFFFDDTATPEIYTLSLHDALPISRGRSGQLPRAAPRRGRRDHRERAASVAQDRKSTRLNSSHSSISYAVFCLKKKKLLAPPHSLGLSPDTGFSSECTFALH